MSNTREYNPNPTRREVLEFMLQEDERRLAVATDAEQIASLKRYQRKHEYELKHINNTTGNFN